MFLKEYAIRGVKFVLVRLPKLVVRFFRVLKPGGTFLFVAPVGKPQLSYNAHPIYTFEQVAQYMSALKLRQFSMVPDAGGFMINAHRMLGASQADDADAFGS